jgi:parallel beta helix pectate lyase-like protein
MNVHSILVRAGLALLVLGSWTFMSAPGAAAQATQPGFAISASQSSPVTGAVRLTAAVRAEPGLIGVYFAVDGYVQEAIQTEAPYDIWWSAASAANGEHTITAKAHYASGEWIQSAPLRLTVANPVTFSRTLYVDAASGDDTRDGLSPSTAWRTLDQVNQAVVAGDTVLLQGTFTGQRLAPSVSGTAARPIKFTSYPGTTAVLDVGRTGRAVLLDAGRSHIVLERLRIQNVPGYAIEITAGANHNVVRDSYITGSGNATVWGHGVRITQSSDNLVEGNQIVDTGDERANSGDSVWIANGSRRNRVLNNRLTNGGHSLIQIGGDGPDDEEVIDNVVARNVMSNRWATPLILSWRARWTIVEYNRISDGARSGVTSARPGIQLNASNNIIRYNEVFDNTGAGIYVAAYGFRPIGQDGVILQDSIGNWIYFNVFYGNGAVPDRAPDLPATGAPPGADRAGLAILMFEQDGRTVRDNVVAYNIFYRNSGFRFGDAIYSIVIDHGRAPAPWPEGSLNGNRIMNNSILREPGSAGELAVLHIRQPDQAGNRAYTLAQFETAHPGAANNLEVDPRFTDEENRVFTLREDSPAFAAGW